MRFQLFAVVLGASLLAGACGKKEEAPAKPEPAKPEPATAIDAAPLPEPAGSGAALPAPPATTLVELKNGKGEAVGTVTLSADGKGVSLALDLKALPPGEHAIHVHEKPDCTAPDFKSAGGHWNPAKKQHGMQNPEGAHAGDIPNLTVAADGTLKATIIAPGVTYDRAETSVFGPTGTALMIHASADDNKTDPSGNAGDRIACGVIKAP